MKNITIFIAAISSLFTACTGNQQEDDILINHFETPLEIHPEWTTLFTNTYTITPLETTPNCLIGQIDKIKKFKGHYYICFSGGQSICHFDGEGKFVATLNKRGGGPEEYNRIEDFDVYEINGKTEVWVSDNENLKRYDADDFSFKNKIPFSFAIYKFKRLENSNILLVTGKNEKILTITDNQGNIVAEHLKKEIPYLMFRSVQFVSCQSKYLYQLGISNAYIAFDPETETFREGIFVKDNSFLSPEKLVDLFTTHGNDFMMEAMKGSFINNIVALDDKIWMQTYVGGKNYLSKIEYGETISTQFKYGTVLSTISSGDSDDSILMYINPDQLAEYGKEVFDKTGKKIEYRIEDNPYILEFF